MNHLFKSRKDYSNIKLTDTQQLAWVNRINPSYPCSKLQQIHQSIQMSPTDKLTHLACSIKQSSHKIITTSTYIISSSKVLISLQNWSRYSSLAKYMLIQGLSTLGGLVLSIQRFHLWGLQLDIYHNKVQQYQWRYFHYTSLLAQQRPTSF